MRFVVRLSEKSDADLISLMQQIGTNNFNALVKIALKTMIEPCASAAKIDALLQEADMPTPTKNSFQISLTSAKDRELELILDQINPKMRSAMIKNMIRQVVGLKRLYKFYYNTTEFYQYYIDFEKNLLYSKVTDEDLTAKNTKVEPVKPKVRKVKAKPKKEETEVKEEIKEVKAPEPAPKMEEKPATLNIPPSTQLPFPEVSRADDDDDDSFLDLYT